MSKVIAVCGAPFSGKTVTALQIVRELASRKNKKTGEYYNVAYVSTDYDIPALPSIFPCRKVIRSLSTCLSSPEISRAPLLASAMTIDKFNNIIYFGFSDGENEYSFPLPPEEKSESFFVNLKQLVDYVVVDCTSFIRNNTLTDVALRCADRVIFTYSYTLKSISYVSSMTDRYRFRVDENRTIKCLELVDDVKYSVPLATIAARYGGIDFTIPYCKEVREQEREGNLAYRNETKKYRSEIKKIVDKIIEEGFKNAISEEE